VRSSPYVNSGIDGEAMNNGKIIGTGPFNAGSGWKTLDGERILSMGCTTWWKHGMTTPPVQGHYVEGGAGNNILVWYDCNVLPGWVTI
jgi:hypothetical protein